MPEEIQGNATENPEVVNAEAKLDAAFASIRQEANKPPVIEEEPAREILKLPVKEVEEPNEISPKEFVDVNDPQVQKKINYLYKQVKTSDESNSLLKDELQRLTNSLEEKARNEEILAKKLFSIENRFIQKDDEEILSQLRSQYNEAINNYDYEKAGQINEKLVDFKTEQKLNSIIQQQQQFQQQQLQNNLKSQAIKAQDYSPQEVADANRIVSEKAPDGTLLRPWLQEGDSRMNDAIDIAAAVSNKFIRQTGKRPALASVMTEVDKIMGLQQSPQKDNSLRHPPVLSSNTTIGGSSISQTNALSDLERTYASKLGIDEKSYARMKKFSSSGPISMSHFKK
jgi:hypothetical protein